MSVEKIIHEHLTKKNVPVFFTGQATGEVLVPRVVIKVDQTSKFNDLSTTLSLYDILCYVPLNKGSTLSEFALTIKEYMKELQPAIMPTYFETAPFLDPTIQGHMTSIQYRNYKKI